MRAICLIFMTKLNKLDISYELSPKEMIYMKCQAIFSGEKEKKSFKIVVSLLVRDQPN